MLLAISASYGCHRSASPAATPTLSASRPSVVPLLTVYETADAAAAHLLGSPAFALDSRGRTISVDRMDDATPDSTFQHNFDLFLNRFQTSLFQRSNGRVQLIASRATPQTLPARNGPLPMPPTTELHPDYLLSGKATDLRRGYQLDLTVSSSRERTTVWKSSFDVYAGR